MERGGLTWRYFGGKNDNMAAEWAMKSIVGSALDPLSGCSVPDVTVRADRGLQLVAQWAWGLG